MICPDKSVSENQNIVYLKVFTIYVGSDDDEQEEDTGGFGGDRREVESVIRV